MFIGGSGGPWRGRGGNASDTPVGQGTPLVIGAPPDIFNISRPSWSKEQKKKEEELEQSRAEEERTRESVDPEETVEDMLDRWNREYPKEEREKEVLEKLEGLDAPKKEESSEPPESAASE